MHIPPHIERLRSNVHEVKRLVAIHAQLTGTGPGRRHDVQVLNKSAVLLVVATWESFVESLVLTGATYLSENVEDISKLPPKPKAAIARRLEADKHEAAVWALAADGWKAQLCEEAKERIRRLNTPTVANVDSVFFHCLGFSKLSSHWHWPGGTHESVLNRLNNLLSLRHEIAHGIEMSRSVTKRYVERSNDFVIRLAAISSNRVRGHLKKIAGEAPWTVFVKGNAK